MGFVLFAVLMASAFMEKGTMQSIFSAIGDLISIFTGEGTLESVLTDDTPPEERFAFAREPLDMMHEEMATALGISTDDFKELLTYGDDLNKILNQNDVDTGAITINQLNKMKNNPEQLRSLLFNDGVINDLLSHKKLGPFMVEQMFTNPKLAETALGGMNDLSEQSKGVLLEAIRAGHIDQAALNDLLNALQHGDKEPQTLIRERILTLLPQEQQGALIMSELQDALLDQQKMEQYLTDHASEQFKDAEVSLQQTAKFLVTNRDHLQTILGDDGMKQLAQMIANKEELPPLTDMQGLLTHPNADQLREIMAARITNDTNGNQVEQALTQLDFSMLPADLARFSKLGAKLLASTSDEGLFHGTDDSNLDAFARLANNPQALQAVNGVINQLKQSEGSDISIVLPKEVRDTVLTSLKEMNFDIEASIPFLEEELDAEALKRQIEMAKTTHSADPNNREFLEGGIDGMVQARAAKMIKEAPGRQ